MLAEPLLATFFIPESPSPLQNAKTIAFIPLWNEIESDAFLVSYENSFLWNQSRHLGTGDYFHEYLTWLMSCDEIPSLVPVIWKVHFISRIKHSLFIKRCSCGSWSFTRFAESANVQSHSPFSCSLSSVNFWQSLLISKSLTLNAPHV